MISSMQSALSALQAYGTKIQATASNVANAGTEGYQRTRVTLTSMEPGGVEAQISKPEIPGPMVYEHTAAGLALIEQSNVDLGRELPEMMLNSRIYSANLKTLQAADALLENALNIKA